MERDLKPEITWLYNPPKTGGFLGHQQTYHEYVSISSEKKVIDVPANFIYILPGRSPK